VYGRGRLLGFFATSGDRRLKITTDRVLLHHGDARVGIILKIPFKGNEIEQDPEEDRKDDKRRPSVAKHRQRNPHDRSHADDHVHVDPHVDKEEKRETGSDRFDEVVVAVDMGDAQQMDDEEYVGEDHDHHPGKPQPLPEIREDKVTRSNREKFELSLGRFVFGFAVEASGSDGDESLLDVVAGFAEEVVDPLFLVGFDEVKLPGCGHGDDREEQDTDGDFWVDPGQKQDPKSRHQQHQCRPEVGLLGDEIKRQQNHHREFGQIFEAVTLFGGRIASDQIREHQHNTDFDELGGLDGEVRAGDRQPTLGTEDADPKFFDGGKQKDVEKIAQRSKPPQDPLPWDKSGKDHAQGPHDIIDHLLLEEAGVDLLDQHGGDQQEREDLEDEDVVEILWNFSEIIRNLFAIHPRP